MSTIPERRRTPREQARRERLQRERAAAAALARRRRLVRLLAALAAAAVVVIVMVAVSGGTRSAGATGASGPVPGARASRTMLAGIPQNGIELGDPAAPVRVVEFADLQCPFCREFDENDLPRVVARYVRPGKVRMEFRALAFIGPDSRRAARVAEATGEQNRLWSFVDLAYHDGGRENSGWATDATLRRIAGSIGGLDTARAFRDRAGSAVDAQLEAAQLLATSSGVDATPTFLVGRGRHLTAVGPAGLDAALDAALAR